MSYEDVYRCFEEKGCILLTSKETFASLTGPLYCQKFEFIAKCTHPNEVTFTNFKSKGTGVYCKDCVATKIKKTLKDMSKETNGDLAKIIEFNGLKYVTEILNEYFDIKKTNEGCLADLMIKPKYQMEDKWMMIQLKTTSNICHNLYSFRMGGNQYENCMVLCICIGDKSIWLFHWSEVIRKNTLNIGKTDRSTWSNNKHSPETIVEALHTAYAISPKFNEKYIMIPINYYQQREQVFIKKREEAFPMIMFEYPEIDCRRYDFIINGYTVQEKVAGIRKDRLNSYFCFLCANNGDKGISSYDKGANNFYWIWLPDQDVFYIFPESVLIERNLVGRNDNTKPVLSITQKSWVNDYKYNVTDVEKVTKLFE